MDCQMEGVMVRPQEGTELAPSALWEPTGGIEGQFSVITSDTVW